MLPDQTNLLFPLLETLRDAGGAMRPQHVYDELAARVSLSDEDRNATTTNGAEGRSINAWERRVRNTRQQAATRGLIENDSERRRFNLWSLTEQANAGLLNCRPGVCITLFTTTLGRAIWAEAETAVGLFSDNSIDLIVSSPPYPLQRKKVYGNREEAAHVEWLLEVLAAWKQKLTLSGSLILNMGDVWLKGQPVMSLYQERLILRLCDELGFQLNEKLFWQNPAKLPSPAEWVTVRRVRVTPSVEQMWWLSRSANPKANNAAVLRPYSESMKRKIAVCGEGKGRLRPSGHALKADSFSEDRGGSIAQSLLVASNTVSNDTYQQSCRKYGLPVHPARFPDEVPAFAIKFLTDPGDHVVDIFGGSAKTGKVAEQLKRRWTVIEKSLRYACGGIFNFSDDTIHSFDRDLFAEAVS